MAGTRERVSTRTRSAHVNDFNCWHTSFHVCVHVYPSSVACMRSNYRLRHLRQCICDYHCAMQSLSLSLSFSIEGLPYTHTRVTIRFSRVNMFPVFVPTAFIALAQRWQWLSVISVFHFYFLSEILYRWTIRCAHAIFTVAEAPFIYAQHFNVLLLNSIKWSFVRQRVRVQHGCSRAVNSNQFKRAIMMIIICNLKRTIYRITMTMTVSLLKFSAPISHLKSLSDTNQYVCRAEQTIIRTFIVNAIWILIESVIKHMLVPRRKFRLKGGWLLWRIHNIQSSDVSIVRFGMELSMSPDQTRFVASDSVTFWSEWKMN